MNRNPTHPDSRHWKGILYSQGFENQPPDLKKAYFNFILATNYGSKLSAPLLKKALDIPEKLKEQAVTALKNYYPDSNSSL